MQHTIFIDIDGCIFKHHGGPVSDVVEKETELLPGVKEKIGQWFTDGHYICLTTARPECWRLRTEFLLSTFAIPYHQLVMGIGHGIRTLINDSKPNMKQTAFSITIDRNKGFEKLELPKPHSDPQKYTGISINFEPCVNFKTSNLIFYPPITYKYIIGSYPEGCACEGCCRLAGIEKPVITHSIYINKENPSERVFYAREDVVPLDIIKQVREKYGV